MRWIRYTVASLVIFLIVGTVRTQPRDLVICFDTSGSMRFRLLPQNRNIPGTCADMEGLLAGGVHQELTRYRVAQDAVTTLANDLLGKMADVFPGVGNVHVVRFPMVGSSDAQSFTTTAGSNPFKSHAGNDIFDFLTNNMTIECVYGTPMANGLKLSNDLLHPATASDPVSACLPGMAGKPMGADAPDTLQMILLICDGQPTDATFHSNIDANINAGLAANVCDDTQINAIGIGNYASNDYFGILNKVASRRRGEFFAFVPATATTVGSFGGTQISSFYPVLVLKSLQGYFMGVLGYQRAIDPGGLINPGDKLSFPFRTTFLDTSLVFAIHANVEDRNRITARIRPAINVAISNTDADSPGNYFIGNGFKSKYFVFSKDFIHSYPGVWQIELEAPRGNNRPVEFFYSVFVQSPLKAGTEFSGFTFATGEFFNGKTKVEFQDSVLKDVQVSASYIAPRNWRGNWNAQQKLNDEEIRLVKEGLPLGPGNALPWAEDTPLVDRKAVYLERFRKKVFTEKFDREFTSKVFYDDGNHSDDQPSDGIFNSRFLELKKPGLHQILFKITGTVSGETPIPFQREFLLHSYVETNVAGSWKDSRIEFLPVFEKREDNQKVVKVKVRFKDKYGNTPLPGKAENITIAPDSLTGSPRGSLVDRLDGEYTQEIVYNPDQGKPVIRVSYSEVTFPERKVVFVPKWSFASAAWKLFIERDLPFTDALLYGVIADRTISQCLRIEAAVGVGASEDSLGNSGIVQLSNVNLKLNLLNKDEYTPYLTAGASFLRFSGFSNNDLAYGINAGIGFKYSISERFSLRFEAGDHLIFDLLNRDTSHNIKIGGGFVYSIY